MDCPAALRATAKGGYVKERVFFVDEQTAIEAGFRHCAACLPGTFFGDTKRHDTRDYYRYVTETCCIIMNNYTY